MSTPSSKLIFDALVAKRKSERDQSIGRIYYDNPRDGRKAYMSDWAMESLDKLADAAVDLDLEDQALLKEAIDSPDRFNFLRQRGTIRDAKRNIEEAASAILIYSKTREQTPEKAAANVRADVKVVPPLDKPTEIK